VSLLLEPGFEGPLHQGTWTVTDTAGGHVIKLRGKYAAMISLMVSGYRLRDDFDPLESFTGESLAPGRMNAKVVTPDVDTSMAEGPG
jgi:hypothetical protein